MSFTSSFFISKYELMLWQNELFNEILLNSIPINLCDKVENLYMHISLKN